MYMELKEFISIFLFTNFILFHYRIRNGLHKVEKIYRMH